VYPDYDTPENLVLELINNLLERKVAPDADDMKLLVLLLGLCGNRERTQVNGSANDTSFCSGIDELQQALPGVFDSAHTFVQYWNVRFVNCIKTAFGNCSKLEPCEERILFRALDIFLRVVEVLFPGSIVYIAGIGGVEEDRVLAKFSEAHPPKDYSKITLIIKADVKVHFSTLSVGYPSYLTPDSQRISRTNGILRNLVVDMCKLDSSDSSIADVYKRAETYLDKSTKVPYVQIEPYKGKQLEEMIEHHSSRRQRGWMRAVARFNNKDPDDLASITEADVKRYRRHIGRLGGKASFKSQTATYFRIEIGEVTDAISWSLANSATSVRLPHSTRFQSRK
jgi:hypothetical protein